MIIIATTNCYLALEMVCDDLLEPAVEALAVLVEHHGVGIPVQLLETQPRVVLPLDLLGNRQDEDKNTSQPPRVLVLVQD